ncbi:MAG: hypothetical protein P8075_10240 [Deltaproteobacteria bacterium]|jgi:hypothetical protein
MSNTDNLKKQFLSDIHLAQKKFEFYEKFYRDISGDRKKYLQACSKAYKKESLALRKIIQPHINKNCPKCDGCCKLYDPELSIYMSDSIGVFEFIDYLLVRCDTVLPDISINNMEENLCAFWAYGCSLPDDCRSFTCMQWFCDTLKTELDMRAISKHLGVLESVIKNFSVKKCLGLDTEFSSRNLD